MGKAEWAPKEAPESQPAADRQELRRFSKEIAPAERKRLADEIWEKRREKALARQGQEQILASLVAAVKERELRALEIVGRMKEISALLSERKANKLKSVLGFIDSRYKAQEKGDLADEAVAVAREHEALSQAAAEVRQQLKDRSMVSEAKEEIGAFYKQQEEVWTDYQEGERARDLTGAMAEYEVFFIHTVKSGLGVEGNTILQAGVDWRTKARITLGLEPTLSASSIRTGDTLDNIWKADVGIIFGGGRILDAYAADAATKAKGIKRRDFGDDSIPIQDRIKSAVVDRPKNKYNEFVIENPSARAITINLDENSPDEFLYASPQGAIGQAAAFAMEVGLPLFAMRGGKLYRIEIRTAVKPKTDNFSGESQPAEYAFLGAEVSRSEATGGPPISDAVRERLTQEILEENPFVVETPERNLTMVMRPAGQVDYMRVFAGARAAELSSAGAGETALASSYRENGNRWTRREYIVRAGKLVVRSTGNLNTNSAEVQTVEDPYETLTAEKYGASAYGELGRFGVDVSIESPEYFESVQKVITKYRTRLDNPLHEDGSKKLPWENRFDATALNEISMYLYGFGEQAAALGDTVRRDAAWRLAEQIQPLVELQKLVERRVGPDGRFKITKEDIE